MNRKLHNTVIALFATSGLLALSLMAAHPAADPTVARSTLTAAPIARGDTVAQRTQTQRHAQSAAAAELAAEAAVMAAVVTALDQTAAASADDVPVRPVRRHRARQSVAMPFFSFFPKG